MSPTKRMKGLLVSNPIKVAALGFWHVHASEYAERIRHHPDTELVAIWDDDPQRGQAAAEANHAAFVGDLEDLLTREDINAVTVTAATTEHHRIMLRAAQVRKHIFTEKLLAPTVEEAEQIIEAADKAEVTLVVSLPRLYHGYTQAITELLDRGQLGELTFCRIRLSHDGSIAGWLPERFYDPTAAVGGAFSDLGCHPVYLTQLFLGTAPAAVSATYDSFTKRQVEDQAVVTLRYPNGAIAVVETGFLSRDPFTIEIHGTRSSLAYDGVANVLRMRSAGEDTWEPQPVPEGEPDPISRWVSHMHDGSRADDNLARAVELSRLVSAANAAAAGGTSLRYPVNAA